MSKDKAGEITEIQLSAEARSAAQERKKKSGRAKYAKNAERLAEQVKNAGDRLNNTRAEAIAAALQEDDGAAAEALAKCAARLRPAPSRSTFPELVRGAIEVMQRRGAGLERAIATPWPSVNAKTRGGFWPGLYQLASASGVGKTQWGIQCALFAAQTFAEEHHIACEEHARQGLPAPEGPHRVAYVALELGPVDLVARMLGVLAANAGVTPEELGARHPIRWSDLYFGRVPRALNEIAERFGHDLGNLPIDPETADAIGWSYLDLRKLAEQTKPRLLVLDYSQLVSSPADLRRREELRETIGNVAKVARDLARRQGMTVLALSSTARSNYGSVDGASTDPVEGGSGGKKKAQALGEGDAGRLIGLGKESGELEFTSDVVLALAREREQADASETRATWLAIAKGRGFPTGWVKMQWDGSRFTEDENDDAPSGTMKL